MRGRILPLSFFRRDALVVAEELLGKFLVLEKAGEKIRLMVTEVEVYDGAEDKANHASKGRTARTEVMFAAGGVWYVYLCYGMYFMLNIVTGKKDHPAAILIRGACPEQSRRVENFNGPGKVTRHLKIDKKFNGQPANQKTGLYFEDRGGKVEPTQIKRLPRVGVAYAGPTWSKKKWRFMLDQSKQK